MRRWKMLVVVKDGVSNQSEIQSDTDRQTLYEEIVKALNRKNDFVVLGGAVIRRDYIQVVNLEEITE